MSADAWNPGRYERFKAERRQPFDDLVGLVRPWPGMRVVDLGCGPGSLTAEMHEALGAWETVGLDSSQAMLAKAASLAREGLRFDLGDIADFEGRGLDLVFSNAALHWVPIDHAELLSKLARALAPGGQIAVQVPANFDQPTHVVASELAGEEPYAAALGGRREFLSVLRPEEYATLLDRLGFEEQVVRLQVYPHHLESREAAFDWVRGTMLTAYETRLPPEVFARFLEEYRERLVARLPDERPFFFPFKRILFWGRLPGRPSVTEGGRPR